MAIEKREIARFAVIDVTGGNVGNVYFEVHQVIEEDGAQIGGAHRANVSADVADVAEYVGANNAQLAAANQTLHAQNTALQAEVEALTTRLGNAVAALHKVAEADASWDHGVRSGVTSVLTAEAQ